jgi:hypothetical protein
MPGSGLRGREVMSAYRAAGTIAASVLLAVSCARIS